MEVHAHTHTARKKWTHYLWEFLMLFLAVFCGFIAENIREHSVEQRRGKEYIKLLIEDLQTDTAILHGQIPRMRQAVSGLDTLIRETYAYLEGKADTRLMYYTYHHYCRNVFLLTLSQRAINQLKSSGNMRLIHDQRTAGIVSAAEVGFQQLEEQSRFYRLRQEDPASFGLRIFDFREYQKANTNPDGSTDFREEGFLRLNYQPALNTRDTVYLKEFAARVGYYRNSFNIYLLYLQNAIPSIEAPIAYLKKKYKY
jgi:hypothetical protein